MKMTLSVADWEWIECSDYISSCCSTEDKNQSRERPTFPIKHWKKKKHTHYIIEPTQKRQTKLFLQSWNPIEGHFTSACYFRPHRHVEYKNDRIADTPILTILQSAHLWNCEWLKKSGECHLDKKCPLSKIIPTQPMAKACLHFSV